MQTIWKSDLDPVIASPLWQGRQVDDVKLLVGANTINHGLGRKLQGWFPVLKSNAADISDLQMTNPIPDKTLQLVSTATVTVSLWVY